MLQSSHSQITKLNSNNYATWKFKMQMLLIKEDLYDVIEDQPPSPLDNKWIKRDRQCRAMINLFIEDSQIIHIKYETTAKDTWEKLRQVHERSNLSSKLFLLRKLYSLKLEENGDMQIHINTLLELIDKLKAIGENIKDDHVSALLLCSLPSSYDTLITALEARPEGELTPEFIKGKLIDEFNRRSETNSSESKALKASFRNKTKKEKFCTYCNRNNHFRSECFYLKQKPKQRGDMRHYTSNKANAGFKNRQYKNSCNLASNEAEIKEKTLDSSDCRIEGVENVVALSSYKINSKASDKFIIDSGASNHLVNNRDYFSQFEHRNPSSIIIANGSKLNTAGSGTIHFKTEYPKQKISEVILSEALYVPELETNLISVKKITEKGFSVLFNGNKCVIEKNDKIFMECYAINGLYQIQPVKTNEETSVHVAFECRNQNCIQVWHRRLGHRSNDAIKQLVNKGLADGITLDNCKHENTCVQCIKCKLTDSPYPKESKFKTSKPLDLVHTDVCGPIQIPSVSGNLYFVTFVDDYSRFTMIYLMKRKNEVTSKLKQFVALTNNKFGRKVKILRSDNGGEYINKELEEYFVKHGIHHQLTVPHCPAQNGVSERKNRTLIEMTRCLLADSGLPKKYWAEAILTANYLQNRIPTKPNKKTPYELWNNKKPDLSHLRTFGCKAFAYIHKSKRGKLDETAVEGILMGYDSKSKGYRILLPDDKIVISRTVRFIEDYSNTDVPVISLKQNVDDDPVDENVKKEEISENTEMPESEDQSAELRRSNRITKGQPPDRYGYHANFSDSPEPKDWKEIQTLNKEEKRKWLEATKEEMKSLEENGTWELVELPKGRKAIGCKWTFKAKRNENGEINRYKARLVAKGFSQKYGTDYDETFAPVVKHTTIRSFLTSATYKNMKIRHIDVKTAFLHGNLEEEIYMDQPDGYVKAGEENKVCKLKKAIYGLKQAARAWNQRIAKSLLQKHFKQSEVDPCLFIKDDSMYIVLYVDDILIASRNDEETSKLIEDLKNEYDIKDLGEVRHYLGIEITKTKDGNLGLSQTRKIEEIVKKFHLEAEKPTYLPMYPNYQKSKEHEELLPDNALFRKAVGALLYIATLTRPDIANAVNLLSRRNENPRVKDWIAVKKLISYLNTTKDLKLLITRQGKPVLSCYCDADWGNDEETRKSTSGYIFRIGNTTISWNSKRQNTIALSSTEAEYIAVSHAAQEAQFLLNLLEDLGMKQDHPLIIFEDNKSCIKLSQSYKNNARTKHIDIKHHFIRDLQEKKVIQLEYCKSTEMLADMLTKPLPKPQFEKLRNLIQLAD